jgi:type I restriction enzyme S subunit
MSTLKELLKDVPVEWKALGDISEIIRGVRVTKNDLISDGIYPVVSGGTGYMGYVNKYNRDANSITIAQYGTAGFVKWQAERFWANDVAFTIFPKSENVLDKKYLYYFLISKQEYLYEISNKIAVPYSISKDKILQIQIPIPYPNDPEKSLAIQQEIVRILDGLSEQNKALTTALAQEIDQRKKQYEYYREELFRFEDKEVEWKTLGEVLKIKNGKDYKDFNDGNIPVYGSGGIMTYIDTYVFDKPSVLIPRKGSLKNLFFVDVPFWTVDTIFWTDINITIVKPNMYTTT